MAYCRIDANSDVYIFSMKEFRKGATTFMCSACKLMRYVEELSTHGSFVAASPTSMMEHLKKHQERGHKVSPKIFKMLAKAQEPQVKVRTGKRWRLK